MVIFALSCFGLLLFLWLSLVGSIPLNPKGYRFQASFAEATQLAKDNIRVVGIAPGSILFEGGSWHKRQQADPEGIAEFVKRELPFGRFGTPEEIGDVVAFLVSARASWISGTTVVVDGSQSRMF